MDRSVTVVIPARSELSWHALVRAVASARSQTHRPTEVVVVVDHDTTYFRRVRRDLAGVTVLENTYGKGVTGSRNTGAYHATTPLVAFLDDTAVADPDWLATLTPAFDDPAAVGSGTAVRRTTFREVGGFRDGTDTDLAHRMTALDGGHWHHPQSPLIRHDRPASPLARTARLTTRVTTRLTDSLRAHQTGTPGTHPAGPTNTRQTGTPGAHPADFAGTPAGETLGARLRRRLRALR